MKQTLFDKGEAVQGVAGRDATDPRLLVAKITGKKPTEARASTTDPESRAMKFADGGFASLDAIDAFTRCPFAAARSAARSPCCTRSHTT